MNAVAKSCFLLIGCAFVLIGLGESPAFAEAPDDSSTGESAQVDSGSPSESQTPTPAAPDSEAESVRVSSAGHVTVDFKDADIQNVLRVLSYKSGLNIVAGKEVVGTVTIRLVDVPWQKALDMVLKTYGYAYEKDGNIIRVTTIENLKKEDLSTEVFPLNYAQASEVEKSLKDVLSERGKIRFDARSNTLVVTDIPTSLLRVKGVIETLDKATPQVVIETKVVETALGSADRLGIKWNVRAKVSGTKRPTTLPFPAIQRTFYHRFLPDGQPSQTATSSIGTSGSTSTDTTTTFPARANQPSFPLTTPKDFLFGALDFSEFQAVLELLEQRDNTKILSEPHVTTLNNQEAKILVGEVISIPIFERNNTTGKMEITGYKDRDLGITLSVVPQVNSLNEIVITIHPKIETLIGYDVLTPELNAPRFSTREAKTRVRIKNGQTIAIGGLIKENTVEKKTKVPLLGDLPILNTLFNYQNKVVERTDLLFFMTVNIVGEGALPAGHKL